MSLVLPCTLACPPSLACRRQKRTQLRLPQGLLLTRTAGGREPPLSPLRLRRPRQRRQPRYQVLPGLWAGQMPQVGTRPRRLWPQRVWYLLLECGRYRFESEMARLGHLACRELVEAACWLAAATLPQQSLLLAWTARLPPRAQSAAALSAMPAVPIAAQTPQPPVLALARPLAEGLSQLHQLPMGSSSVVREEPGLAKPRARWHYHLAAPPQWGQTPAQHSLPLRPLGGHWWAYAKTLPLEWRQIRRWVPKLWRRRRMPRKPI